MSSGEIPEFGSSDIEFGVPEALKFQEQIVLPAIDLKWGRDFIQHIVPGSGLQQTVPLYEGRYDTWCRLECGYESVDGGVDEIESEETDGGLYINLTIFTRNDEILEDLKAAYIAERLDRIQNLRGRKLRKTTRKLKAEVRTERLTAWEITTYSFYPVGDESFDASKKYELRDEDDETIWDTSTIGWDFESVEEDRDPGIDDLQQNLDRTISAEDYFVIMDSLVALGMLPRPDESSEDD